MRPDITATGLGRFLMTIHNQSNVKATARFIRFRKKVNSDLKFDDFFLQRLESMLDAINVYG